MLLALVAIAACGSEKSESASKTSDAEIAARVKSGPFDDVTPAELVRMYRANSVAADRDYKGQVLRVTGVVDRVGQDAEGVPLVVLRNNMADDSERLLTIRCAWTGDRAAVAAFDVGAKVVLRGIGAGLFGGEPLVGFCDGARAPAEAASAIPAPTADPYYWRRNLEMFIQGKDVKKYKITYADKDETVVGIETDKCDRAKLGVEQLGSLPPGFVVTCTAKSAVQWKLP